MGGDSRVSKLEDKMECENERRIKIGAIEGKY